MFSNFTRADGIVLYMDFCMVLFDHVKLFYVYVVMFKSINIIK